MESIIAKLRSLDAYPKINEDFYSRTLSGGFITLASSIIMLLLFISELRLYLYAVTETKLMVDTSRGERLRINFDVTFPALPCSIVSIDAMDISGEQHLDVRHDIIKKRIDAHGNIIETRTDTIGSPKIERPLQKHGGRLEHNETYCGSCYGAETADDDCCNNCEDVREAYRKKGWALTNPDEIDQCKREGFLQKIKDEDGEGCNLYGFLDVNKMSHKINRLAFGEYFPGVVNPLDGVQWTQHTPNAMYQYFLKVVPTVFTDVDGHTIQSNQFSVTEHVKGSELGHLQALPGVFFHYELSPIKVTFTEAHVSFLHFLTNVCAIIGGVFTVSGIIDSFIYHGHRAIKKKTGNW
ncbi:endoplasmic reticulum-golgi intermediate compartment protein 3 [Phtheirospermum japonicum]|uniref:Endoplasmic reticulum-golgi intermediate compartment protein 3 n=1 Tax=Phtheirospermum japonicum TaxID=374723 RepID=A0A830CV55_9LAMI|nr:endoplasmic reticulum-golgi intermediate compartment protein 3 [Phtheirospermum japonicum]